MVSDGVLIVFDVWIRLGRENAFIPLHKRLRSKIFKNIRGHIEIESPQLRLFAKRSLYVMRAKIAFDIAHELGHLIAAPLWRRYRKDYGIPVRKYTDKSITKWDLDEAKAILIQYQLLYEFGFNGRIHIQKDPLASYRRNSLRDIRIKANAWWNDVGQ